MERDKTFRLFGKSNRAYALDLAEAYERCETTEDIKDEGISYDILCSLTKLGNSGIFPFIQARDMRVMINIWKPHDGHWVASSKYWIGDYSIWWDIFAAIEDNEVALIFEANAKLLREFAEKF